MQILDEAFTVGIANGSCPWDLRSRLIFVPIHLSALVAFEPFETLALKSTTVTIDDFKRLPFQV